MSFGECLSINSPMPLVVHRVYQDQDGHKMMTIEVPTTLVGHLGAKRLEDILQQAQRGLDRRKRSSTLKSAIIDRLQTGDSPTTIASDLGCTSAYVRLIRGQLKPKA